MIAKFIPNPGYADAFNSIERTPRGVEAAATPTSIILQQHNQQTPNMQQYGNNSVSVYAAATAAANEKSIRQILEKNSSLRMQEESESLKMKQYDTMLNSKSSLTNALRSEGRQFEDI